MSTRKAVAEFNARRSKLLVFFAGRIGQKLTTSDVAIALGTSSIRIQNTLSAMRRELEVKCAPGGLRDGRPQMLWWVDAEPSVTRQPVVKNPFRPLRPMRCTVIPVRAGGRMAPVISDDPRIGMGHWSHNPYSPTQDALQ